MSAAAASVSPYRHSNRLMPLRHKRPQPKRRLRALRARNEARIAVSAMEMFSRVTGIQHRVRKVRSRKVDRIVILAKTETKIPISITTKSRVTIRKIRRLHPRRPRRRDTIGTMATGTDVIPASS
jgi:hypothetical protein